ncbi:YraN family protein [Anaerofilum sp. BX8]|uniref:UPF0102 protein H8S23_00485 n=1 Tax=Anaerofilum hominis TaxID=2763016 RepID=A0A923I475_9FIRM|nr:YraN family protein [Anaerofilum hominis]MBC5579978.1 YraN family protein [Anaerofilum hominis]
MDRKTAGIMGEVAAAKLYRKAGYRLLASNFRTRQGEIDLVAEGAGCLVFAEVKTRAEGGIASPREAVTPAKQRRIVAAAKGYLEKFGDSGRPVRFDVVEVYYSGDAVTRVEQIENAFTA